MPVFIIHQRKQNKTVHFKKLTLKQKKNTGKSLVGANCPYQVKKKIINYNLRIKKQQQPTMEKHLISIICPYQLKKNQTSLQTEHVCNINFILNCLYFQPAENTDEVIVGLR